MQYATGRMDNHFCAILYLNSYYSIYLLMTFYYLIWTRFNSNVYYSIQNFTNTINNLLRVIGKKYI